MDGKQRTEQFERVRRELEAQGLNATPCTVSVGRANLMALVTAGPVAALCAALFFLIYRGGSGSFTLPGLLMFYAGLLASIPVHECIHGLVWSLFCKNGLKSIHIGMIWKKLTPYCCCMEPLQFGAYLAGGLAPFVLLGLGLFAAAMATGSVPLLLLGAFNILAAGGDTTIALMLLRHRKAQIIDHPTECGFWAFEAVKDREMV